MSRESIDAYLEADAAARKPMFAAFTRALDQLAKQGEVDAVDELARRAVSPDLEYGSLLALRRFVRRPGPRDIELRLAVLGGPTTSQLVDVLKLFLSADGIAADVYEGGYGLFRQEILAPDSGLDRFQPQIVFIATSARDAGRWPTAGASPADLDRLAELEAAEWQTLWERVRTRWGAAVIQNTFDVGAPSVWGHFAVRHPGAPERFLEEVVRRFADRAPAHVAFHDLQALVGAAGSREWFDPRFYLHAKMPCGPGCLVEYGHSVASVVRAMTGKSRRALVLDLDNTLWGGVVGDVGPEHIAVGQGSSEAEAFMAMQSYAKALHERGILLAVCSKNDEGNARNAFATRPEMPLATSDFSCFVANWNNKAANLRDIAQRLSLGLDSLVFVDDNPAERAVVRRLAPEVAVPDLPADPAGYVAAIARHRYFETTSWTEEDASRVRYYEQNAQRTALASSAQDIDAFLASLDMRALAAPVHAANVERVAQLVNKSNQFNLTTRRRTVAELEAIAADPGWTTVTLSLKDRLGDSGLISVILLRFEAAACVIDTWLMSCRVLQRGVEEFALNAIVEACRARRCRRLDGTYTPTARNGLVRDHYARLGFEPAGSDGVSTFWTLDIDSYSPRAMFIRPEAEAAYV